MSSFRRSDSLIRKKQEQWAKEKADEEASKDWFPFGTGSPGGGCPNRKFEARDYSNVSTSDHRQSEAEAQKAETSSSSSAMNQSQSSVQAELRSEHNYSDSENHRHASNQQHCQQQQQQHHEAVNMNNMPNLIPIYPPNANGMGMMNPTMQFQMGPQWPGQPFMMPYGFLPPGAIPMPMNVLSDSLTKHEPICPASLIQSQMAANYWNQIPVQYSLPAEMTQSQCSSVGGAPTMTSQQRSSQSPMKHGGEDERGSRAASISAQEVVGGANVTSSRDARAMTSSSRESDAMTSSRHEMTSSRDPMTSSARSMTSSHRSSIPTGDVILTAEEIKEQIQMRKRHDEEDSRRELAEIERIIRDREEKIRREQTAKEIEESKKQHDEQLRQRRSMEHSALIEQAAKEAEILRKARLYKHVLESSDVTSEEERRFLGAEGETARRAMEQAKQIERQKRHDRESLDYERESRKLTKEAGGGGASSRSMSSPAKSRTMSTGSDDGAQNSQRGAKSTRNDVTHSKKTTPIRPTTTQMKSLEDHNITVNQHHQHASYDDRPIRPSEISSNNQQNQDWRHVSYEDRPIQPAKHNNFEIEFEMDQNANFSTNKQVISSPSASPLSRYSLGRQSLRTPKKRETSLPIGRSNENISRAALPPVPPPLASRSSDFFSRRTVSNLESNAVLARQLIDNIPDYSPCPKPRTRTSKVEESALYTPLVCRQRMRTALESPVQPSFPQNSSIQTIGSLDSNDGTSSSEDNNTEEHHSPIPSIRVDLDNNDITLKQRPRELQMDHPRTPESEGRTRSRSAVSSPLFYLNGRQSPLSQSIFSRKIAEKGCNQHTEDVLSPDIRRQAEASLSRQSSMNSLRGSFSNLRASVNNLHLAGGELSPTLEGRFRSMNPVYRSFNTKRTSDRNKETLEKLNKMREQLRSKENFVERGLHSRQSSNLSVRQ